MADPPATSSNSTGETRAGGERTTPSTALEGDSKAKAGYSRARLPAWAKAEQAAKAQREEEEETEKKTATTGNLSTTPQPTLLTTTAPRSNTPTPSTLPSGSTTAVSRSRLPPVVRPSPSPAPSVASSTSTTNTPKKQQRSPRQVAVVEIPPRSKSLKPTLSKERDGSQGSKSEEVRHTTIETRGTNAEQTGLGINLGGQSETMKGQETEKGKERQKDAEKMDISMELDSASDTMTSENGGKTGEEALSESKAADYVALCVETLKNLDVSKPGDREQLGQRLVNLFRILHQMHQAVHPPPPPPPAVLLPSSPIVSSSALEELELRMIARMDKVKQERDGEIESLKAQLAQQETERFSLKVKYRELEAGLASAKKTAEEAKREAEEAKNLGQDSRQPFDTTSIDKRIDDRLSLARKPIFDAAAAKAVANTEGIIDQVRIDFDNKVNKIDEGFQEWWITEQANFNQYWLDKVSDWEAKTASTSRTPHQFGNIPRSAPSSSLLPVNSAPTDPRRTTSLHSHPSASSSVSSASVSSSSRLPPTGPSLSRLPPTGPSSSRLPPQSNTARASPLATAASRPSQSPNHSPRPGSPIEPSTSSISAPVPPSGSDFVTQAQLKNARSRGVDEMKALERSVKDRMEYQRKEFDGKLAKLGLSAGDDQGVGSESRSGSPVATRTANKTARNGGEIEVQTAGEDGRPSKRPRTEGPSTVDLAAALEGAKSDMQAAKEAIKRIEEIDTQLKALKSTVDSEQRKVSNIETRLSEDGQKWEEDKTEILARMVDGNKRVSRNSEIELKKLSDSTDKSINDLNRRTGGIETDVERRISSVENSFNKKLSDAETGLARSISTVDNDLNKKLTGLETGLETKIAAGQQASTKSLSKVERKLEKNISSVETQAHQLQREKDEIKKRVEGVEERCAGLTVEISESTERHRGDQASNQSALNDLRQQVNGKASEEMVLQQITELQHAIANPKPISPKEILPYVQAEFTARHLDELPHHVFQLQAATDQCQEALKRISSQQSHASQLLDVCHLSLSNLKQESLADSEALEAFQVTVKSRFDSLETTSSKTATELVQFKADLDQTATSIREQHELDVERITETIRTSKSRSEDDPRFTKLVNDVDRLTRAPSTDELESRILHLRSIFEAAQSTLASHQSTLDAIRSKPTPPASPTLPSTQTLSTAVASTSTIPRAELSPEQKSELQSLLFRSLEDLSKRPDSWLRAEISGIRQPLEARMDSWVTRFDALDQTTRKITDVELSVRTLHRVFESCDDKLKDTKTILENRVKPIEAYLKQLSPSLSYVYTSLQAILNEAQTMPPQITPQTQPQAQSQLSSSQNGSYQQNQAQAQAQAHAQMQSVQQATLQQFQQNQQNQNQVHQQRSSSLSNSASRPGSAPNNHSYPTQHVNAPPPPQHQPHNTSGIAALGHYTPYGFSPSFPS